jgi:stage V sporulation protein G
MQITEVRVRLMDSPKMRAVASVTFDGCFVVHDIKIIDGQNGMFIAMPSRKMAENDFRDIAHPLNSFTRDMIKEAVFDAYDRALREEMNKSDEEAERVAAKFF